MQQNSFGKYRQATLYVLRSIALHVEKPSSTYKLTLVYVPANLDPTKCNHLLLGEGVLLLY